jgi:bleomycin hydrolase
MQGINKEELKKFKSNYENKDYSASHAALARTEMKDVVSLPQNAAKLARDFSIEVKTRGITAQLKSGRCWMYSMLNILREQVAEKCNLDEFKLSSNYIIFYDKLEKANNFMEMIIEHKDKPLSDHWNEYILKGPGDGGYFDMARDLVKKYGVIPEYVMPDTYQSSHTESFLKIYIHMLHKAAYTLRKAIKEHQDVQAIKQELLSEIYQLECICFGTPVESFDFVYHDKDGEYHEEKDITPQEFYSKYCDIQLDNFVTLTNQITENKPLNSHFTFHYIGSMADGCIDCVNVSIEEIEKACIAQLQDGMPVWFGCDAGAYGDRLEGVWDPDSFAYKSLLGIDWDMEKSQRLKHRDSFATHAMILTGVNLDENGKPNRWKVENSWGKDVGKDGYFVLSEKYFKEYVYEAIIDKKHLTQAQLDIYNSQPIEILPWESDC